MSMARLTTCPEHQYTSAIASFEPRRLPARLKALRAACFPATLPLPEFRYVTAFSMVEESSLPGVKDAVGGLLVGFLVSLLVGFGELGTLTPAAAAMRLAAAVSSWADLAFCAAVPALPSSAVVECSMMEASSLDGVVVGCGSRCHMSSTPAAAEQKHLQSDMHAVRSTIQHHAVKAMVPAW